MEIGGGTVQTKRCLAHVHEMIFYRQEFKRGKYENFLFVHVSEGFRIDGYWDETGHDLRMIFNNR